MSQKAPLAAITALCLAVPGMAAAPPQAAFTVNVHLSPKAAAKLSKLREGVVVSVNWQAEPIKPDPEWNTLNVDLTEATLPAAGGAASISTARIKAGALARFKPRTLEAMVSVLSTRRSQPLNLITCAPSLPSALSQLAGRTFAVNCRLIQGE